jgi:hypothetical protein
MTEPIHIISLGAGVQSSTMALMAAHGEITPMPKCAIFADTGYEPSEVYGYLEYLKPLLPFPVYNVQSSRFPNVVRENNHSQIPSFIVGGFGKRQCTSNWKIRPLQKKMRQIAGITAQRTNGIKVIGWQGISLDEIWRMKPSQDHWLEKRFPLIDARMRRYNCENWLTTHDYKIPHKSACVFCPYRSKSQWRQSKIKGGPEWDLICKVSTELAAHHEFLTPECKPIEQCDFSTDEDHGQQVMFGNECEGMCGV